MTYNKARIVLTLLPLLVVVVLLSIRISNAEADWMAKADPALLKELTGNSTAEFLILLADQADLSGASRLNTKAERGRYVYETLTATAERTQAPLRAMLDAYGIPYRPYWISNLIRVRGGRELVTAVAARSDVKYVYANTWQHVQFPPPTVAPLERRPGLIEWNIEIVNAPDVWAEGFRGQGAVIGGQDTGYDWTHPAIKSRYRGWNGSSVNHDFNWHDAIREDFPDVGPPNSCGFDLPAPCDDTGHGTHTMGTIVGDDGQGLKIGMAPGAKWIGCRNMEEGWGSPATYTECYEWFIAPYPRGGDPFTDGDPTKAPHVVNNSWACPAAEGCSAPEILQQVVETVRAAGILPVHSAGNKGPGCASINEPAGIYDAALTVGATDDQNTITFFSGRGPVTVDGSNRRKPDIVAPGDNVMSSIPGNGYAFLSGTSMAAPHVTGLAALLISAKPKLTADVNALEVAITQSALPLTTAQNCGTDDVTSIPNNVYGWGRIDALAALEFIGSDIIAYDTYMPVLVPRR